MQMIMMYMTNTTLMFLRVTQQHGNLPRGKQKQHLVFSLPVEQQQQGNLPRVKQRQHFVLPP